MSGGIKIYWERQDPGTLTCGLHCLNNLLQGPYFKIEELSQIAQEIDSQENHLLDHEFPKVTINYLQKSQNISDWGDYSIQVLMKALYKKGPFYVSPFDEIKLVSIDIDKEVGFICHSSYHWFAIRKVAGAWFKLNSLAKEPYKLGDFYLR